MSSVTFLSPPVPSMPLMAANTADMPPPPALGSLLSVASGGGFGTPPLGIGGPLPLPPAFPPAAGAADPPEPRGAAAKYSTMSTPWAFQTRPILKFAAHQSVRSFTKSLRALIHWVSGGFFFCITFIAWKSIASSTFFTWPAGEAMVTRVTMFNASATDFWWWKNSLRLSQAFWAACPSVMTGPRTFPQSASFGFLHLPDASRSSRRNFTHDLKVSVPSVTSFTPSSAAALSMAGSLSLTKASNSETTAGSSAAAGAAPGGEAPWPLPWLCSRRSATRSSLARMSLNGLRSAPDIADAGVQWRAPCT
mmetsp:Transcript_35956/g.101244  ORF Transcript_35956/g.101244 Transcript_35956/m.101244 type:complete len:307 (+) Transcript_35956:684-1604(+)